MNTKRYFKLDETDSRFLNLTEDEKILVSEGHKLVKKYIADKAKADNHKNFAQALDDMVNEVVEKNRSEKYNDALIKHCMKYAGFDVADFNIKKVKDPNVNKNPLFRTKFNAILSQVITPIAPAMISTEYMNLADISNISWGESARFVVKSNDSFLVTRIAEGILRGSVQRVYNNELFVNPEPYNIETAIDWYQVASGIFDLGEFVYKVGTAFSNYITLMVVTAIESFVTSGLTTAYKSSGFTTSKFATMVDRVKAANGGGEITAYGTLASLLAILPGTGASSVVTALQQGLGQEWADMGYLGRYMGVDMVRIPQIILPNTVNTTALFGVPDNVVYFFANGGYKPVKLVFEGSAASIDIVPTDAPDKEMGISVTMRIGQTLVNASKFGAITDITAPTGA